MRKTALGCMLLAAILTTTAWGQDHESAFDAKDLLRSDAKDLKQTVVTPHLEAPIEAGKSVLWCASFQLAWNEMGDLLGGNVQIADAPPMVAALNKRTATKADLDDASYVAMAGRTEDDIYDKIERALAQKFAGAATPRLLREERGPGALDAWVAYAYLYKNLEFAIPFQSINDRVMNFGDRPVQWFGVTTDLDADPAIFKQIRVLHFEGEHEKDPIVILELVTKAKDDQLILAMVPPKKTLAGMIDDVRQRIAKSEPQDVDPLFQMFVPKLNFDLRRTYDEIEGKTLKGAGGLPVRRAVQDIRFQLNERGAMLRSEALKGIFGGPTNVVFNRPFLILMQRRDAKNPYFALWVDNAEVLMPESPRRIELLGKLPFDEVRPFSEGLACVRVGSKWGYIDREGRTVVAPQFAAAGDFHDGRARVAVIENLKREVVVMRGAMPKRDKPNEGEIRPGDKVTRDGGKVIIERNGEVIVRDETDVPEKGEAPPAKVETRVIEHGTLAWGYINATGRMVVPARFAACDDFHEGRARVSADEKPTVNLSYPIDAYREDNIFGEPHLAIESFAKLGIIDLDGNIVIEPKHDDITNFVEGFALVVTEAHDFADDAEKQMRPNCLIVGRDGKPLVDREFIDAKPFSEGLAPFEITDPATPADAKDIQTLWGVIDREGKVVIEPAYESIRPFHEGVAVAEKGGKTGFLHRDGSFYPWAVQDISGYDDETRNGRIPFVRRDRGITGYMDTKGRVVIRDVYMPDLCGFSDGLAAVRKPPDGAWGFIDPDGKVVIDFQFWLVGSFENGRAPACSQQQKWGHIDKKGRWVVKPKYERAHPYREGLGRICLNTKIGFIDRAGKLVIPCDFSEARDFREGLAPVALQVGMGRHEPILKWGFVDKSGKVLEVR